jgi:hypothetical protein
MLKIEGNVLRTVDQSPDSPLDFVSNTAGALSTPMRFD